MTDETVSIQKAEYDRMKAVVDSSRVLCHALSAETGDVTAELQVLTNALYKHDNVGGPPLKTNFN